MHCPTCGLEGDYSTLKCPNCGYSKAELQVLNPRERDSFDGVTIEQGTTAPGTNSDFQNRTYEYRSEGPGPRVYVKQVSIGSGGFGILAKLVMLAIVLFLIFIALPLALLLMAVMGLFWFIRR